MKWMEWIARGIEKEDSVFHVLHHQFLDVNGKPVPPSI
jgi:hypothetical protein